MKWGINDFAPVGKGEIRWASINERTSIFVQIPHGYISLIRWGTAIPLKSQSQSMPMQSVEFPHGHVRMGTYPTDPRRYIVFQKAPLIL